ncbi:MAG: stage V sporulation protein AD, partial [Lachnospiraceae bacterium]|nr:stage V sporulation protein AD [Lachnospiraceae bacterium]
MKQSIMFKNKPLIKSWASVAGKKESEGPLGAYFDVTADDDMYSGKNWEQAESRMQTAAVKKAIYKSGLSMNDIGGIVAGDLLGQLMATSFGISQMQFPFLGVYGACSTMGESIAVASMIVSAGFSDN